MLHKQYAFLSYPKRV